MIHSDSRLIRIVATIPFSSCQVVSGLQGATAVMRPVNLLKSQMVVGLRLSEGSSLPRATLRRVRARALTGTDGDSGQRRVQVPPKVIWLPMSVSTAAFWFARHVQLVLIEFSPPAATMSYNAKTPTWVKSSTSSGTQSENQ